MHRCCSLRDHCQFRAVLFRHLRDPVFIVPLRHFPGCLHHDDHRVYHRAFLYLAWFSARAVDSHRIYRRLRRKYSRWHEGDSRIILLYRQSIREIQRLIHPHAIIPIKIGGQKTSDTVISAVWGFFFLYIANFAVMTMLLTATGLDSETAYSAVGACITNLGPALGIRRAKLCRVE